VLLLQLLAIALLVVLTVFFCRQRIRHHQSALKSVCSPDRPRQPARAVDARQVTAHLEAYLSGHPAGHHPAGLGLNWLGEPFLAQMIEPFFALVDVTSPAPIHTGYCRFRLVTEVNQKKVYRGVTHTKGTSLVKRDGYSDSSQVLRAAISMRDGFSQADAKNELPIDFEN
jgi:hypothetical protein